MLSADATGSIDPRFSRFDSSKSSTFRSIGRDFFVNFVDNTTIRGVTVQDSINIAGLSVPALEFGLATSLSTQTAPHAGFVGLRPSNGTTSNFIEELARDNVIASQTFAFFVDKTHNNGALTLGGVDTARYSGALKWLPVVNRVRNADNRPLLHVLTTRIDVNGQRIDLGPNFGTEFEIATSVTSLPFDIADRVNSILNLTKVTNVEPFLYAAECPGGVIPANKYPDVKFDFGNGNVVTISPEDYLFRQPTTTPGLVACVSGFAGQNITRFNFPSDKVVTKAIFGVVFMRAFYTVFDLSRGRIGLAPANREPVVQSNLQPLGPDAGPIGTAPLPNSSNGPGKDSGTKRAKLSGGVIAGIALGSLLAIALLAGIVIYRKRRALKANDPKLTLTDKDEPYLIEIVADVEERPNADQQFGNVRQQTLSSDVRQSVSAPDNLPGGPEPQQSVSADVRQSVSLPAGPLADTQPVLHEEMHVAGQDVGAVAPFMPDTLTYRRSTINGAEPSLTLQTDTVHPSADILTTATNSTPSKSPDEQPPPYQTLSRDPNSTTSPSLTSTPTILHSESSSSPPPAPSPKDTHRTSYQPAPLGRKHIASMEFTPNPTQQHANENAIPVSPGDVVYVQQVFGDGWAKGWNATKDASGVFLYCCVERVV